MDEVTVLFVIFEDDNRAYAQGLWLLLEEAFNFHGIKLHRIDDESSKKSRADIFVVYLMAGMEAICHPELKIRKGRGTFIFISEGLNDPYIHTLPVCIQNNIFIRRNESVESVRHKLRCVWTFMRQKYFDTEDFCQNCQPVSLTKAEVVVAQNFCRGQTLNQIALTTLSTPKTISTHKRNLMSKLNLHSDAELLNFMTHWMSMVLDNDFEI